MRIGLDSDGVIYNLTRAYNAKLISLGAKLNLEDEAQSWDYYKEHGFTSEQFFDHLNEMVDAKEIFWTGDLYEPDIPEWIDKLREAGHTIHIVTNRFSGIKECSQEATKHWFREKGVNYDSLTFSKDKTVVETDIFLEDNLNNFEAIWRANRTCYLVNRPYNQTGEDEAFRVDTFGEFAKKWLPNSAWSMAEVNIRGLSVGR